MASLYRMLMAAGFVACSVLPAAAQESTHGNKTCFGPQDACRQIMDLGNQYDAAYGKGDVSGMANIFASGAVIMQPGPALLGRQAIESAFQTVFKKGPGSNSTTEFDQVHILGDIAWAVGSWKADWPGPNNTTEQHHGTWGGVDVLEGGVWKIQMLTWNTIENPAEVETAANPSLQQHNPAERKKLNQEAAERLKKEGK